MVWLLMGFSGGPVRKQKCASVFHRNQRIFLLHNIQLFTFRNVRKISKNYYWLRRNCPSVRPLGTTWLPLAGLSWNLVFEHFPKKKTAEKIQVSLKSYKNNSYFTYGCMWIYDSKAIPLQTLRVPGGWGSHILKQSAHEGGKVVSPTHRPPLPQEIFLVLTSVRGWVYPRAIRQWKNPVTPSRIEPAASGL
jgi:hypothetical protein